MICWKVRVLVFGLAVLCPAPGAGAARDDQILVQPYLQNIAVDGVTVMWETVAPSAGRVSYWAPGEKAATAGEPEKRKIHRVRLSNLNPGTRYFYQVLTADSRADSASFRTPGQESPFNWRLAAYGDNRSRPEMHAAVVRRILAENPDLLINSGDLVQDGRVYEQWKREFFDPAAPLIKNVPVYPVLGNHEHNSEWFYRYFDLPDFQPQGYYSLDYGGTHLTFLYTDLDFEPDGSDPQTRWLEQDLSRHKEALWKVVVFHNPLFRAMPSRGVEGQRWIWQPLFEKYGVDLVLNGHDHYYLRCLPVGTTGPDGVRRAVTHIITGGGGAPCYTATPEIYAAARKIDLHCVILDFDRESITGRALDTAGVVFDAFTINKNYERLPEQFASYPAFEFERDLGRAIYASAPLSAGEGPLRASLKLDVPTNFKIAINADLAWEAAPGWRIEPAKKHLRLNPADTLCLEWELEARAGALYPLPGVRLSFSLPGGELPFVNKDFLFFPLKIRPDLKVRLNRLTGEPKLDGEPDEPLWGSVEPLSRFSDSNADSLALSRSEARLGLFKDVLYLAARCEAPASTLRGEKRKRDSSGCLGDEYFCLCLASGGNVYNFLVTAQGSLYDACGEDENWNGRFNAAVAANSQGWSLELAVPLEQFGRSRPDRINLVRRDRANGKSYELTPTFAPVNRGGRLPVYGVRLDDPASLTELETGR